MPDPRFSVIIPARNEERSLESCIAATRAALAEYHRLSGSSHELEFIVVANRCTDRTEEIAKGLGAIVVHDETKNLSHIRNTGARAARGEWLITIDADSRMSLNMISEIARLLSDPRYVGGGVVIRLDRYSLGIIISALALLPIIFWSGPISAGLFYCRHEDFWQIGGFDESLSSVEDIDFARRLKRFGKARGQRFATIWRGYIRTSTRKFDRFGDWYFLRNPAQFLRLLRGRSQADADKVWYDFER